MNCDIGMDTLEMVKNTGFMNGWMEKNLVD